jgi:hypothetical protein
MTKWDAVSYSVSEYSPLGGGDLEHCEKVERLADGVLVAWCSEYLAEHEIELDPEAVAVVRRLVADAVLRQDAMVHEIWSRVAAWLKQRAASPAD